MAQLDVIEQRMAQSEQDLLGEIQELRRRLAVEADWTF
jgi:hypothetical protein